MASRRGKGSPDERARFARAIIVRLNRPESQPPPRTPIVDPLRPILDSEMQLKTFLSTVISVVLLCGGTFAQKLVLTNDDGWAVAQIRAQRDALVDAGFDVRVFYLALLLVIITRCENRLFYLPQRRTNPEPARLRRHLSRCLSRASSTHAPPDPLLRASTRATVRTPLLFSWQSTLT